MIQTDFFETLLKRVKGRPLQGKTPAIAKNADEFEFNGHRVSVLRRPYQRSLGVIVKPNGHIRVTASKSASSRSIWRFLKECEAWIEKTQGEHQELRNRHPQKKMIHGESLLFLGRPHQLVFLKGHRKTHKVIVGDSRISFFVARAYWEQFESSSHNVGLEKLRAFEKFEHPELKPQLTKFFEKESRQILKDRVEHFSQAMQLFPKALSFRAQKTRWGSCGANGHISLNWKLVAAPLDILDYVVIHELAHLKHPNHSKNFWQLVEEHSPKHKSHRRWLSQNQYSLDFLSKKSELYS